MRAGRTKHRVILERLVDTVDQAGGHVEIYRAIKSVWMALEPIRMKEAMQSEALVGFSMYRGVSRYIPGIEYTNRVTWRNRHFYVQGQPKNIDERDFELEWELKEVLSNG